MNDGLFLNERFFDVLGNLFPEVPEDSLKILYYLSIGLNRSSIESVSSLTEGKIHHKINLIMKGLEVNSLTALREVYHCRMISYFVNNQCSWSV